jgi:endonuclease/exonuclease/phosphatase family metal-dependent hydrolase
LKVISWNVLRLIGARVEDVAALIEFHRPDLLLLQEATKDLEALPTLVGGCFFREPLDGRIYGLAAWSPHSLAPPYALPLPISQVPGRVPPRVAQILQLDGVTFANVHLSHGQILNRSQLLHVVSALDGPAAVIGDYNAVGPIRLAGFRDVGPRRATHSRNDFIAFRLDRCMARGLRCSNAQILDRGPSDHHPIRLDLQVLSRVRASDEAGIIHPRRRRLHASVQRWAKAMSDGRARFGGRHPFFGKLGLRLPRQKSSMPASRRDRHAAQIHEHAGESRLT